MNRLNSTPETDIHLVKLDWPLNAHWADKTVQVFKNLAEQGVERVIVNMENVPFIDSRGLIALLTGLKVLGDDPEKMKLAALQSQIKLFFRLTKFDQVFCITENGLSEAGASPFQASAV